MSDRMTGMSFDQLMNWVTEELENHGTLFGLHRAYKAPEEALTIFGRDLETPIGRQPFLRTENRSDHGR